MKLFVGNPTARRAVFNYRMPETGKLVEKPIAPGEQEFICDYETHVLDEILHLHIETYGMVEAKNFAKRGADALIFQFDRPIPMGRLGDAVEQQDEVLTQRGEEQQKLAAVVADKAIESALKETPGLNAKMKKTTVEVEEEKRQDRDPMMGEKAIAVDHAAEGRRKGR